MQGVIVRRCVLVVISMSLQTWRSGTSTNNICNRAQQNGELHHGSWRGDVRDNVCERGAVCERDSVCERNTVCERDTVCQRDAVCVRGTLCERDAVCEGHCV